jgi:hypothetical protein
MEKIIETVDNFRILEETRFNFDSGATQKLYRVQELKNREKIVERWYGFKTVYVLGWEYVSGPMTLFIPHNFKTLKIARKYIKYRIKYDKKPDEPSESLQKSN